MRNGRKNTMVGVPVETLFIPKKAANVANAISGTQTQAAFCNPSNGAPFAVAIAPAVPPKREIVTTKGITFCITATPKFPNPAFIPNE